MIIGIDGNEANIKSRVGVNVFAYELLKQLNIQNRKHNKHQFVVYLRSQPLSDLPRQSAHWKYKVLKGRGLWSFSRLMPHLLFNPDRPDVLFMPNHYVPPITLMPKVCSIMDLGFLKDKGQFKLLTFWQLKYWTAISISVSKYIIAISNATKIDIKKHYNVESEKINIVHLAYDKEVYNTKVPPSAVERVKRKYKTGNDYILYLGTLKPSKNIEGLLTSFAKLPSSTPKLVVAGKKGWFYDSIFARVNELDIKSRVVFTDYFPEKEKPALMAGAKVLVSPSFTEGFGLHALEAMAVGIPVVVSNIGSFPEVVGTAGILVNPKNTKSIAKGMEKVLKMDESGYNNLVKKGLAQVNKFSWDKTTKGILKVIEKSV